MDERFCSGGGEIKRRYYWRRQPAWYLLVGQRLGQRNLAEFPNRALLWGGRFGSLRRMWLPTSPTATPFPADLRVSWHPFNAKFRSLFPSHKWTTQVQYSQGFPKPLVSLPAPQVPVGKGEDSDSWVMRKWPFLGFLQPTGGFASSHIQSTVLRHLRGQVPGVLHSHLYGSLVGLVGFYLPASESVCLFLNGLFGHPKRQGERAIKADQPESISEPWCLLLGGVILLLLEFIVTQDQKGDLTQAKSRIKHCPLVLL